MKREDLEKLGLTKEQIDAVCDMHHDEMKQTKADLQKAQDDLKVAQDKVATTEEALKKFEGVDAEALKQQIATLTADLAKKDNDHAAELAERDFRDSTKAAIAKYKGKNEKAIMALLDLEALKASKNQAADLESALKALAEAEDSKMLFGDVEIEVGTGDPIGSFSKGGNYDEMAAMRAAMGLPDESKK